MIDKRDEVTEIIKQRVIEKLKDDNLVYAPGLKEDKKYRKFLAIRTVDLKNATVENISDYSLSIYKTIKYYLQNENIDASVYFNIYGFDRLGYNNSFDDLIRGIFYYKPIKTNYDKIHAMGLEDLAAQFAELVIKTLKISADDNNERIEEKTPEIPQKNKIELFNAFKDWLEQEAE